MAKAHKITGVEPAHSYRKNARIILPQKVEEVYSWEPFIWEAARREELHNMRISVKRLRYTMELFGSVYHDSRQQSVFDFRKDEVTSPLQKFLEVVIDLQEILGDVHDSDVVLEVLADYASRSGNQREQDAALPGVAKLIARTKKTRAADYETFLEKWKQLSATGFKEKIVGIFNVITW